MYENSSCSPASPTLVTSDNTCYHFILISYSSSCVVIATIFASSSDYKYWVSFYVVIVYLYFLYEMSVKIICPLKSWVVLLILRGVLFIFWYKIYCKCLLRGSLSFHFLNGIFQRTEVFNVEEFQFIIFFHGAYFMWPEQSLHNSKMSKDILLFSSKYYNFSCNI